MLITEAVEALWKLRSDHKKKKAFYDLFKKFIEKNPKAREGIVAIGPRGAEVLRKFDKMASEVYVAEKERREKEERLRKKKVRERIRKDRAERKRRLAELAEYVSSLAMPLFERCFLEADLSFGMAISDDAVPGFSRKDIMKEYSRQKRDFVKQWISDNGPRDDKGGRQIPDDEQAEAIANTDRHVQVIARAGSGKTSTVVNRALFLIKHCKISPSQILMIAFNRKAVIELRKRLLLALSENAEPAFIEEINRRKNNKHVIKAELDIESEAVDATVDSLNVGLPHVLTFHALAYALVHPTNSLLFDGAEPTEGQELSRTVQKIIDDHLRDPTHYAHIRQLMLAHFRSDWERIESGGFYKNKDEFIKYRRSLPRQSIKGEYVKSYGEKVIADFLFEHDVEYRYERNHWWSGINYRPDFTVFVESNAGIIIEYFGMEGDPDYDEMSDKKRRYWQAKNGWELFEVSPRDVTDSNINALFDRLRNVLRRRGVKMRRLSDDEIWIRVKERAIDRFTRSMVVFISRCRKLVLTPDDLKSMFQRYETTSNVERQFLDIGLLVYSAYLHYLKATGEEDFDGLLQRAAAEIQSGNTVFSSRKSCGDLAKLKYVFIDEYQDFSRLFHDLVMAIHEQSAGVKVFCVGDDWQAINGFAGANLEYFRNFEKYVSPVAKKYISTNYRSAANIVDVGNGLMVGLGKPARAYKKEGGRVVLADIGTFEPTRLEKEQTPGDAITPVVTRLVAKGLSMDQDVVILARKNSILWYVNYGDLQKSYATGLGEFLEQIRSRFPDGQRKRISISTTHKYKGMEKPVVIVLDAVERAYPLIHPDWIFTRMLGDCLDKIVDEDRRLLYVALTRAIDTLFIITEKKKKSPFLRYLYERGNIDVIDWGEYPPPVGTERRIVVQVGNANRHGEGGTYVIKDLLKAAGYQWRSTGWKAWEKVFTSANFSMDDLKMENWARVASGIEVRLYDDRENIIRVYRLDDASWECIEDNSENFGLVIK